MRMFPNMNFPRVIFKRKIVFNLMVQDAQELRCSKSPTFLIRWTKLQADTLHRPPRLKDTRWRREGPCGLEFAMQCTNGYSWAGPAAAAAARPTIKGRGERGEESRAEQGLSGMAAAGILHFFKLLTDACLV